MAVFQAAEPEITLFISPLGTSPLTLHAFRALRMTCACHSTLAASTGKLVQLSLQEALLVRLVMHGQQLSVSQHHVRVLYHRFGGNGASHLGHGQRRKPPWSRWSGHLGFRAVWVRSRSGCGELHD